MHRIITGNKPFHYFHLAVMDNIASKKQVKVTTEEQPVIEENWYPLFEQKTYSTNVTNTSKGLLFHIL